jgi:hypothetical protein
MNTGALGLGPVELVAVKFPGNRFTGEIIDALNELVDRGTIRIVDVIFAARDECGRVRTLGLDDLDPESFAALEPLVEETLGILSEEDAARMGAVLHNGISAGLLLCENILATRFSAAVGHARNELSCSYASARVRRSSASSDRLV